MEVAECLCWTILQFLSSALKEGIVRLELCDRNAEHDIAIFLTFQIEVGQQQQQLSINVQHRVNRVCG